MKKATVLSLLLLAHITVMVHVVIPHHHHRYESAAICTAHHESDRAAHSDNDAPEAGGLENCHISSVYIYAGNQKPLDQPVDAPFSPDACGLFLCSNCVLTQRTAQAGLTCHPKPYIPFVAAGPIARSAGLRAPPFA
jgi:hypothetical protein